MGHNSVVSGYPKSKGIPRVDGLLMGSPVWGVTSQHIGGSEEGQQVESMYRLH